MDTNSNQLDLLAPLARSRNRGRPKRASPPLRLGVAGLFAGIGGVELGLARGGHETTLLCEFDLAANAVLEERFPRLMRHGDVRTLVRVPRETDLIAAGFPCQDLSQAGKTAGISGARSGLVGEVFRLLEKQQVPWVLLENVPFMLQLAKGEALDVIVAELERLGYAWAYRVLDSRAFGVPQRRERVFLLASRVGDPRDYLLTDDEGPPEEPDRHGRAFGFYWTEGIRGLGAAIDAVPTLKGGSTIGIPSPPAILMPDGSIVKPDIRDIERLQGFAVDWTKPAEAVTRKGYRWKLVGNAVTVDTASWIGRKLANPGHYDSSNDPLLRRRGAWPRAAWGVAGHRHVAHVSAWPVVTRRKPLAEFLRYEPELLSARATAGFLERASRGSLRFPDGFLDAVRAHLARVSSRAA
ncbi:MAG: DNA (cytosine-5-)-methyltransferase [Myxococcaceae bacterium]|nr:DNA (cytosine-5-)-methyltransferase [Myxococcaceae bacterium]